MQDNNNQEVPFNLPLTTKTTETTNESSEQSSSDKPIDKRPRHFMGDRNRTSHRRPMHTPAELSLHGQMAEGHVPKSRKPISEPEQPKHPDGRAIRQPFDGQAHLYEVIQVRLARTQRLVEINTCGLRLIPGTPVLIRVHRNILLATTVGYRYRRVAEINSLPFVVRIASIEDQRIDAENAIIERQAYELASNYAMEQNLQMKVLSADLSHDHKNITINFASDIRVDFREMVSYLSGQLKLRIEMYQLGLRNGTGIICGLGACGQLLCCGRFLGQFDPIAVKQLRAQGMATNPKRISGVCGRLYCCMSYEYCDYMKERRTLPKKGRKIFSRWGIGRVTDIDTLREEVVVTYDNGESQRLTPHDFVSVTDEIQSKADAGEYEFPLEPIKFYLNHAPAAAAEMDNHTKTQIRQTPHHVNPLSKPAESPHEESVAKPATEHPSIPQHSRRKKPIPKHKVPHLAPQAPAHSEATNSQAKPQTSTPAQMPVKVRRVRTEITVRPESKPSQSGTAPTVPPQPTPSREIPPGTRMPRKIKARQANLEESLNNDSRPIPAKTSRRRYTPFTQPPTPNT